MKYFKILLVVIVIGSVAVFVNNSRVNNLKPPEQTPPPTTNPFVEEIRQDIAALEKKPANKFCNDYYNEILYKLKDYDEKNRLGDNKEQNQAQFDQLNKMIYVAYSGRFIDQAFYVFKNQEWKQEDLEFIKTECKSLEQSPLLQRNGGTYNKLTRIRAILDKYDEVLGFISSCKSFSFMKTDLDADFPIGLVQRKISVAKDYQNARTGNLYVNNCKRLQNELKEIPQIMFRAHVRYLDNLIGKWSGMYVKYNSQKAYANGLYRQVKNKIDGLDGSVYKIPELDTENLRLTKMWERDGVKAYNFLDSK